MFLNKIYKNKQIYLILLKVILIWRESQRLILMAVRSRKVAIRVRMTERKMKLLCWLS